MRRVIVTGGSGGIGRAISRGFADLGERVAIVGRNEDALRETSKDLSSGGGYAVADVGAGQEILSAVDDLVDRLGGLDVLVANAGFTRPVTQDPVRRSGAALGRGCGCEPEGRVPDVYGRRAAPRASWGRVIIVSSIGAFTGGRRPGSLAYASAKSGLLGLTYALARELGLEGITSSPARFFT